MQSVLDERMKKKFGKKKNDTDEKPQDKSGHQGPKTGPKMSTLK